MAIKPVKSERNGEDELMRVVSIDPGDVHNGVAFATLDPNAVPGKQLILRWQGDWPRHQLFAELEGYQNSQVSRVDVILLERFRLYPWMAREQGFSEFGTVEVIGTVKYLAARLDVPVVMMDTSNKNPAVSVARANQPRLIKRYPSSQKHPWYFTGKNEHERDALAHLAWFTWRDKTSPLYCPAGTGTRTPGGVA